MAKLTQLQANLTLVTIGNIKFYFSYETVVAVEDSAAILYVSENVWSNATGKHLNAIDGGDKKSRVPHEVFKDRLAVIQERIEEAYV